MNFSSPTTPTDFAFVDAIYRQEEAKHLAKNVFVEALPALPDDITLANTLKHLPRFNPEERNLPGPVRIQMLDTLRTLVVPLPRLVRLARAMLKMLRSGYQKRRPFSAEDNKTLRMLYEQQLTGNFVGVGDDGLAVQHSMALIGSPGSGKTFGLRKVAGLLPPAIHHAELGKWQLPFLFVEMPYDGESIHTLASEIFRELDRLLPDANYSELYQKGINAERRLAIALKLAYQHGVGMIVVDEAQNQKALPNSETTRSRRNAKSTPKADTPLMKLLVTASNTSHMPLCVSGTLETTALVGTRFSRARRMSGRGSGEWLPLESSGDIKKPMEFELMLHALWHYQWTQKPVPLTNAWVKVFFELTQGIPDIIVKLLEAAQEAAIANRSEELTEALVRAVFAKEFFVSSFGITALRDRDQDVLSMIPDLFRPEDFAEEAKPEIASPLARMQNAAATALLKTEKKVERAAQPPQKLLPSPTPLAIDLSVSASADLRGTLDRFVEQPTT